MRKQGILAVCLIHLTSCTNLNGFKVPVQTFALAASSTAQSLTDAIGTIQSQDVAAQNVARRRKYDLRVGVASEWSPFGFTPSQSITQQQANIREIMFTSLKVYASSLADLTSDNLDAQISANTSSLTQSIKKAASPSKLVAGDIGVAATVAVGLADAVIDGTRAHAIVQAAKDAQPHLAALQKLSDDLLEELSNAEHAAQISAWGDYNAILAAANSPTVSIAERDALWRQAAVEGGQYTSPAAISAVKMAVQSMVKTNLEMANQSPTFAAATQQFYQDAQYAAKFYSSYTGK